MSERVRLHPARGALIVGLLVVGGCSQDVAEIGTSTVLSTSPAPPPSSAPHPETTTTSTTSSTPPALQVSLDQVLGGSISTDGLPPPEVAGDPFLDQSSMRAITASGAALIAGGAGSPAGASSTDAAVWTSSDGVTWTRVVDEEGVFGDATESTGMPGHQFINDVVTGPLGVVAVGADGIAIGAGDVATEHDAAVWLSKNGTVWQRIPHDAEVFGGEGTQIMHSVIQTSELVVAVGESDGQGAAWASSDGAAWAPADMNDEYGAAGEPSFMSDVVATGSGLVAVGRGGVDPRPAVWLSADGFTWDRLLDSMAGELSGGESALSAMTAVTAGDRGLIATGMKLVRDDDPSTADRMTGGALVWTSVDAYGWELLEPSFLELSDQQESSRYAYMKRGAPVMLEDVAWDGDRLFAIGGYELAPSANALPDFVTLWVSADGGGTWEIAGESTLEPTFSIRGAVAFSRFGDSVVIVGHDDTPAGRHPDYGWMTYAQTPAVWLADIPAR
jgi:hypothetical protein